MLDTGASHHVTSDLRNLSLHSHYDGLDEVTIGDGTGFPITHVASAKLSTFTYSFTLHEVLCVPKARHNFISISKLCQSNNVYVEFHPFSFCVKDHTMGVTLMHDQSSGDIYTLQPTTKHLSPTQATTLSTIRPPPLLWHARLGHPSLEILQQVFKGNDSVNMPKSHLNYSSRQLNKSHKLPFSESFVTSNSTLELMYSDVWGPLPILLINGFHYYLIFVDHLTRYVWLFTLKFKSDVFDVFPKFCAQVESFFNKKNLFSLHQ